jgi:hypothetical protein
MSINDLSILIRLVLPSISYLHQKVVMDQVFEEERENEYLQKWYLFCTSSYYLSIWSYYIMIHTETWRGYTSCPS